MKTEKKERVQPYNSYWLSRINDMLKFEETNPDNVLAVERAGYYVKVKVREMSSDPRYTIVTSGTTTTYKQKNRKSTSRCSVCIAKSMSTL